MQLTGSQIVIECLKEQGVDTVFGYPGGAILNVYDELYKHSDEIHHVLTSHEQGASHAADGYARVPPEKSVYVWLLPDGCNESGNRYRNRIHGFCSSSGYYL